MVDEKKPLLDASGADQSKEDATATAILRRKKKENGELIDSYISSNTEVLTDPHSPPC
jgi:transitional endoplasmic reticulum ATPase